jgi:hypothetical protein
LQARVLPRMNSKHTWNWLVLAAILFGFIFFFERHWREPAPGPILVLPGLKAGEVSSVQVYPAGQSEIRAERTNATWLLTQPIRYPAKAAAIEALLTTLEHLTLNTPPITARELRHRPKADMEFGLENPQATLVLQPGNNRLRFGALTAPGDQVFLRVVGVEDIYVVDSGLLKLIPRATNDWRDTALVDLRTLTFDRVVITNATRVIELQRNPTNQTWRMTYPMPARADNARLVNSLGKLQMLRVTKFVSDDPGADLDPFGLAPAELEIVLANGTNPVAHLFFGKTNDTGQVFARRQELPGIVAVNGGPLAWWRAPFNFNDFRDHHLLSLPQTIGPVEVHGEDRFTLLPQTNGWRLAPQDFAVDQGLADDFLADLAGFEIEFFKNAVTEPDLRTNGLISPAHEITLKRPTNAGATNAVLVQLSFGITNDNKVLVARADEDSIYALKLSDFQRLPWASWQLRERRFWHFTENDVARLTIHQAGKTRDLARLGTNSWTLSSGSQGVINVFGIEETVHRFGDLAAVRWVDRGLQDRDRYGLATNTLSLTFELKSGQKFVIECGLSPTEHHYAAVTFDKETLVLEYPPALYPLVSSYLSIPSNVP